MILDEARATGQKPEIREKADHIAEVPQSNHYLAPRRMTTPLQMPADHITVLRGTDVDQPKSLAKSVTVE